MQYGTVQKQVQEAVDAVAVRKDLLAWYRAQRRDLPWRRSSDPYAIWLSETMLQQTRVTAVLPYYARFLQRFPTLASLAEAPEAELLAYWAGLGYYTRARNLQRAAQTMNGRFPARYPEIRALAGVGDYTAAAVASIAFGLPHAVVDGNVLRVLSRLHADPADVGRPAGKKHFAGLADALLDRLNPGDFNQAVMELGATTCTPKNPQCLLCPVNTHCQAYKHGRQREFPVKLVEKKQIAELRTVFWIERDGCVLAWRRGPQERLMAGFWELPEAAQLPQAKGRVIATFRHAITFHNYTFRLVRADVPDSCGECEWLRIDALSGLPVSTILRKAARAVAQLRRTNA